LWNAIFTPFDDRVLLDLAIQKEPHPNLLAVDCQSTAYQSEYAKVKDLFRKPKEIAKWIEEAM